MTPDLDTLLRDAGGEPTIDLDVDALHTRGRRRAAGRLVAVGAGALALLGVLGVGALSLLDQPDTPIVDQAPTEESAPEDETPAAETDHTDVPRDATASLADLGVTAVDVIRSRDGAGGLRVRVVTPDGAVEEFSTAAGSLPSQTAQIAVDHDHTLWLNDADPNLLAFAASDAARPISMIEDQSGVGWVVLGSSESGAPLVAQGVGVEGQLPPESEQPSQVVFTVEPDGDLEDRAGSLTGIAGVNVRESLGDERPFAAAAGPEHLAVLSGAGESQTATWHVAGGEAIVLAQTGGLDSWFTDLAIVGDEVWIVANDAGATNLWIAATDGRSLRRVATPVGRDQDGWVTEIQAEQGPDGMVVVLSTATVDDENGVAYLVDVEGARQAGREAVPTADDPTSDGVYDVLDAQGQVHLLPAPERSAGPLAACATDEDMRINAPPNGSGGQVWWLCSDASSLLPDGVGYPFVATEMVSGGDGTMPEDGPENVIRAWADGPSGVAADAGLSGGLEPSLATIDEVTVDGSTVTIDLTPGPQIGMLSTTYASGAFIHGVVGAALQYSELDTVVITLEGSCEEFSGLIEAGGCATYDRSFAPWGQGDGTAVADVVVDDIEDGRHAVMLHGVDSPARTLTFDVIQWLSGEEAEQAYAEDTGQTDGVSNDYWIRNENDLLRTLPVATDVAVQLVRLRDTGGANLTPGTWDELPTYLRDYEPRDGSGRLSYNPFWLTIEDGVVVAIEEQYTP